MLYAIYEYAMQIFFTYPPMSYKLLQLGAWISSNHYTMMEQACNIITPCIMQKDGSASSKDIIDITKCHLNTSDRKQIFLSDLVPLESLLLNVSHYAKFSPRNCLERVSYNFSPITPKSYRTFSINQNSVDQAGYCLVNGGW